MDWLLHWFTHKQDGRSEQTWVSHSPSMPVFIPMQTIIVLLCKVAMLCRTTKRIISMHYSNSYIE